MEAAVDDVTGDTKFIATTLKGHQGSVLCLDLSNPAPIHNHHHDLEVGTKSNPLKGVSTPALSSTSPILLSGSEDQTARLWDLRDHRRRACLCIQTHGHVLSAVFAPNHNVVQASNGLSPFAIDYSIYLAVQNTVLEYDLRQVQAPIVRKVTRNLASVLQHQDEVNQITLANRCITLQKQHKKYFKKGGVGKKGEVRTEHQSATEITPPTANNLFLASCDDAGSIRFTNLDEASASSSSILHHDVNGVALVPTCAFRPISTNKNGKKSLLELASGGTDCKIHLWDLSKPIKPISSFIVDSQHTWNEDDNHNNNNGKPQICNPPMVHSLAWSYSGQTLAAGLGDGSIRIFSIHNRNLVHIATISDGAHDSSVVSVIYPCFSSSSQERCLCSAGTDGNILFWDLGPSLLGEEDEKKNGTLDLFDLNKLFAKSLKLETRDGPSSAFGTPQLLFGIPHGREMNWVTRAVPLVDSDNHYHNAILVADTSNDITCYNIPMSR